MTRPLHQFIAAIMLMTMPYAAMADGESRNNPITVSGQGTFSLFGKADANTTTWFSIDTAMFSSADMLYLKVSGKNYGDVAFFSQESDAPLEMFLTGSQDGTSSEIKKVWNNSMGTLYVAVTQDNSGGTATFSFRNALPGETRQNAIQAQMGSNNGTSSMRNVWFSFTAPEEKVYSLKTQSHVGSIVDAQGHTVSTASTLLSGERMAEGQTIYFQLQVFTDIAFSIESREIEPGYYSDYPLDITEQSQFQVFLPEDPNATNNSSDQSERYWIYTAEKSGSFMWGTADATWVSGMWGCMVRDLETGKALNTPKTAIMSGMVTYTIAVEEGHSYLIAQTVAHTKERNVTVYTIYNEPELGDTRDNPITLALDTKTSLGRTTTNARYYSFTAPSDGIYTAEVHAKGQVRATTPDDGSWNIGRDYSIQDMQMHTDSSIGLKAGQVLLLTVTISTDLDIHVDGSDSSIPDYYILVSRNSDLTQTESKEGEDLEHAIIPLQNAGTALQLTSDEGYYIHYYKVTVPAGDTLIVTTAHNQAVSSPDCIAMLNQDGESITCISEFTEDPASGLKTGRFYTLDPSETEIAVFIATYGVSFLYEGATWSYSLKTGSTNTGIQTSLPEAQSIGVMYHLNGMRANHSSSKGIIIRGDGRKLFRMD